MSIVLNETEIGSEIEFNNTELSEIIFNGVSVWTAAPEIYKTVKNATGNITEAQWLEFLNEGCIEIAIKSGDTSSFIGKQIILSNTYGDRAWKIVDFNHDNTTNTVDLLDTIPIGSIVWDSDPYSTYQYRNSYIRDYVATYYNGFSTAIKNKMQAMAVKSASYTLSDKVKLLSGTEVGVYRSGMPVEGTRYPVFTSADSSRNEWYSSQWWLRTGTDGGALYLYQGTVYAGAVSNKLGVIPCIRFA